MRKHPAEKLDPSLGPTDDRGRFAEIRARVVARFKESPLLYAGIAAGAGFVLGGGLATPTALRVFRKSALLALQATVVPLLFSRLQDAVSANAEE